MLRDDNDDCMQMVLQKLLRQWYHRQWVLFVENATLRRASYVLNAYILNHCCAMVCHNSSYDSFRKLHNENI